MLKNTADCFMFEHFDSIISDINEISNRKIVGSTKSVKGLMIEVDGISRFAVVGARCIIKCRDGSHVQAEVVGVNDNATMIMPFSGINGIGSGLEVELICSDMPIYPSLSWVGRVIDSFGNPIDGKGKLVKGNIKRCIHAPPPNAHSRHRVTERIDMGLKSINTFLTCCRGQRMGIFAGSGVGKSMMMSMLTKFASFDVKVIGLIGERGREVQEFIEDYLGEEGLANSVIVVSTSDESSLSRRQAAYMTMTISEYFRDIGMNVLCMIDSITRFAMAQREIGLASGEPPTTKGYTPSVFTELPKLLERAGPGTGSSGDITGLFSVLVEGDDMNEPIADAVRGTLDGHIVLSRAIAARGVYPTVDVLNSVSRTMPRCNSEEETKLINDAKKLMSLYSDMEDMIRIGAYKQGSDEHVDKAIDKNDQLQGFISQLPHQKFSMEESYKLLQDIIGH